MKLNTKILTLLLFTSIITLSCNDNNEPAQEPEPELETFLCCGENPFESQNIDNLDQTNGEISVFPYTTSNGDALHDYFRINNIEFYPNNIVTISDFEDNVIYSVSNFTGQDITLFFPNNTEVSNGSIPIGTYKYRIVIENEQTFVESGYFCLFQNDTSFVSGLIECGNGEFDPVVAN